MAKTSKKKPLGRGLSSLLGENLNVDNLTNFMAILLLLVFVIIYEI